jgi:hypothetical protein
MKMNSLEELNQQLDNLRMQCRQDEERLRQHWQFLHQNAGSLILEKTLGIKKENQGKISTGVQLFQMATGVLPFILPGGNLSSQLSRGLRLGAALFSGALALRRFLKKKKESKEAPSVMEE